MYPFATLVSNHAHDQASDLDRPGVYRLNVGVGKATFRSLFPEDADQDYAALDVLMPHPVYAAQSWIAVLNPRDETLEKLRPLLHESYRQGEPKFSPASHSQGPGLRPTIRTALASPNHSGVRSALYPNISWAVRDRHRHMVV